MTKSSVAKIKYFKEQLKKIEKDDILELEIKIQKLKKEEMNKKIKNIEDLLELLLLKDENLFKELEEVILQFLKEKNII